jgi:hypothetical protein
MDESSFGFLSRDLTEYEPFCLVKFPRRLFYDNHEVVMSEMVSLLLYEHKVCVSKRNFCDYKYEYNPILTVVPLRMQCLCTCFLVLDLKRKLISTTVPLHRIKVYDSTSLFSIKHELSVAPNMCGML